MREQHALVAHLTPILAGPSTGGVLWVHMEEFRSKSEALQYLECGVERGQYQACGNLKLTEQMDFRGRTYRPYCREKSLGVHDTYRAVASTYCPEGCHFFLSREQFAVQQQQVARQQAMANARTSALHGIGAVLLAPFRYFQKLPGESCSPSSSSCSSWHCSRSSRTPSSKS